MARREGGVGQRSGRALAGSVAARRGNHPPTVKNAPARLLRAGAESQGAFRMSPSAKRRLSGIVKISAVVLVISLGIWGCARKPAESTADRLRSLEARCVKLEQDYRTVAQARDTARKDLAALEEEVNRQRSDAANHEAVIKERDELRRQVETTQFERERLTKQLRDRTSERD